MRYHWHTTLCMTLALWMTVSPVTAGQTSSGRAQLLKAVLNYTEAEDLADTAPNAALARLRAASREAGRCRPGKTIRPEELVILNTRIVTLRERIERRTRLTDQLYKTVRDMYKEHRLESVNRLVATPSDLYLNQTRFLELRGKADADYQKALEYVQIGHSYFNRQQFKKAKHWYEQALRINREYPKLRYYLEQARDQAARESEGFLWGLF